MPNQPRMAPVKTLRHTEQGRENPDPFPISGIEREDRKRPLLWRLLPMIAGNERHYEELPGKKTRKVGVSDHVIGMNMVIMVGDEGSHIMEERGIDEELFLGVRIIMQSAPLSAGEELLGESC